MMTKLHELTLQELQTCLQRNECTSEEIVRSCLEAIAGDTTNAFVISNEQALEQAKAADTARKRGVAGKLAGLPVAVKDVLTTKGMPTTAASNMLRDYVPSYTATAVQRLLDAGMIIVGKTNCDEFAMGSSNENSTFGPVKNPVDPDRVAGGSSGGSAAAVAAKVVPVALGTDTGGSVRLPASFCGIIGFKPTYGRISRYGLLAMASSLDQVGIFARTAHDAAALLEVMAGPDAADATSVHMPVDHYTEAFHDTSKELVIGLPTEYFAEQADPEVQKLFDTTIEKYRALPGVRFEDVSLPHAEHALAVYYIIMPSEVSANMARYDGMRYGAHFKLEGDLRHLYGHTRGESLGAEVRRRILLGTYALSAGYYDAYYAKASKVRSLLRKDFDDAFSKVDLVLCPTSPTPAFKLGEKQADPLTMYLSDIYTVSANLAGLPACSYPVGTVRNLPMGMQLIGPAWSERKILQGIYRLGSI